MWKGHEEISGSYWCRLQHQANSRGLRVDIDIKEAWDLFLAQDRLCAISGLPIDLGIKKQSASLDRKDSDGHYTTDNVWWVHKDVNQMKWDFNLDYFVRVCQLVAAWYPSFSEKDTVGGGGADVSSVVGANS